MIRNFFLVVVILLTTLTTPAWAINRGEENSYLVDSSLFTPVPKDVSIQYLYRIFGSVGNIIVVEDGDGATTATLISKMFGLFNNAILALAAIVIMYTLVVSTLNTAHEGEVLGKKWSTIWLPLRSAAGIGVLLPLPNIGYSMIQIFVMWTIVNGVGLADNIWYTVVKHMDESAEMITDGPQPANMKKAAGNLLTSFMCLDEVSRVLSQTSHYDEKTLSPTLVILQPETNLLGFTWGVDLPSSAWIGKNEWNKEKVKSLQFCGRYHLQLPRNWFDNSRDLDVADRESYVRANQSFIDKVRRVAIQAARSDIPAYFPSGLPRGSGGQCYGNCGDMAKAHRTQEATYKQLDKIIREYFNDLKQISQRVREREQAGRRRSGDLTEYAKRAAERGWIFAGSYFHWMVKQNDKNANLIGAAVLSGNTGRVDNFLTYSKESEDREAGGPVIYDNLSRTRLKGKLASAKAFGEMYGMGRSTIEQRSKFAEALRNITFSDIPLPTPLKTVIRINMPQALMDLIMTGLTLFTKGITDLNDILFSTWQGVFTGDFSSLGGPAFKVNPVTWLSTVGRVMLKLVETVFLVGGFFVLLASTLVGTFGGYIGFGYGSNALVVWILPLMTFVFTGLATAGITLAYYLPLLPTILFIFGALGWFFGVIESMIAAPLVALGLIDPEGHEVYGSVKPAILLLVNILLRPALMVFGFVFGIMMTYIAVNLVNMAFSPAAGFIHQSDTGNEFWDAIFTIHTLPGLVGLFVIYSMLVIAVVSKCFSLIHVVPNKILRWIGGGQESLGELEGSHKEIKDKAGKSGSDAQSAASQGLQSTSGSLHSGGVARGQTMRGQQDKKAQQEIPPQSQ